MSRCSRWTAATCAPQTPRTSYCRHFLARLAPSPSSCLRQPARHHLPPDGPLLLFQVVAFTNSPSVFQPETLGGKTINKETQIRVLGSEINDLKAKLEAEKRKAEAMAIESPAVAGSILEIRHSFVLDESTSGKYVLTVEAPVPLFGVAVQSDVAVHLVEDAGTAIVSHSPPDIVGGSMCLASYRCQEKVNRVEVHMEVVEGQYGSIQAFVIPAVPPKTCTVVNCRLRPLCLHCRAEAPPSDSTPLNELKVTGAFELSDIHSWIAFALPEVVALFCSLPFLHSSPATGARRADTDWRLCRCLTGRPLTARVCSTSRAPSSAQASSARTRRAREHSAATASAPSPS